MITYDVLAFQSNANAAASQNIIEDGNNGVLVTGPKKLAQRFILELMTEKGSITYRPTRGTYFVTEAKAAQLNNEIDVYTSFSLALLDMSNNLIGEESVNDPSNERYKNAEIQSISVRPGSITIGVKVVSLAGTFTNISIPLAFNLKN